MTTDQPRAHMNHNKCTWRHRSTPERGAATGRRCPSASSAAAAGRWPWQLRGACRPERRFLNKKKINKSSSVSEKKNNIFLYKNKGDNHEEKKKEVVQFLKKERININIENVNQFR